MQTVSADATLTLPVSFAGNGAAFLSVTDAFETNASTVETFDIRDYGARNVVIVGARHSLLNGVTAYDARGEENFRGPHAIMMIGCTNVTLKGYTIRDSANWALALFHCAINCLRTGG